MATANQVLERGLRLAGILASGETADAATIQDALGVYNALLAEWHVAEIGIPDYSVASIGATVTTDAADNEAISHQIALRLMPEYGMSASPEFVANAEQTFGRLRLRYFQPARVDFSELPIPSYAFNVFTGE